MAAGTLLRLPGLGTQLWFDELWSLLRVAAFRSPVEVFTAFPSGTNHHVVSLWLWLLGPDRAWWTYRIPSLVAGVGSVLLAARLGQRRSPGTALWCAGIFAFSHLMILYSTEARGYSLACFFALLACERLETFLASRSNGSLAGYWAACVLGALAHPTFLSAAVGLALWSAAVLVLRERRLRPALQFVALQAVPAVFAALWYWFDLRKITDAGGVSVSLWRAVRERAGDLLGIGAAPALQTAAVVLLAAAALAAVARLIRAGDPRWLLYAGACAIGPAVVAALNEQSLRFSRYYIVPACFLILLLGAEIGRLWDRRRLRPLVLSLAVAWLLANAWQTWLFARDGRGHYLEAVRYMDERSPAAPIRFASMGDTRAEVLVGYYRRYLPPQRQPRFVRGRDLMTVAPEWFLNHVVPDEQATMAPLIQFGPVQYRLLKSFPSARLSGFREGVYLRADLAAPP
ncbi:MAG TPA: hypothetical protein VN317_01965 [Candidatus Methanoperedens sp.]|nr:hypothetical protein [Candidatus Methanoperedens sp.]